MLSFSSSRKERKELLLSDMGTTGMWCVGVGMVKRKLQRLRALKADEWVLRISQQIEEK